MWLTAGAVVVLVSLTWPSDPLTNVQMALRWIHFAAGIAWVGLLYFFNLVNVRFMAALDPATRATVVPELMPRALWWFRWASVVTWLAGFFYYMIVVGTERTTGVSLALLLGVWGAAFFLMFIVLRTAPDSQTLNRGAVLAWIVAAVVIAAAAAVVWASPEQSSSRAVSITVGGGLGTFMLLNVWGLIWPLQKRIIAAVAASEKGKALPAEVVYRMRVAFLASRINAWLSLPMLFFMAAASHFPVFGSIPPVP
jgi:uncharacterized membrane protein